jgi:hypothetical protein
VDGLVAQLQPVEFGLGGIDHRRRESLVPPGQSVLMAPANALAFDLPEVLRGLHHPAGLRRPDPDGLDRRPQPVGLLAVGVLHAIDTLEGKDHQGGIGPLPSRGQVIDIVARLYVGVARQAALPALVHPVVRAAGRGLHLRRQGGVLLQWGAQGP